MNLSQIRFNPIKYTFTHESVLFFTKSNTTVHSTSFANSSAAEYS